MVLSIAACTSNNINGLDSNMATRESSDSGITNFTKHTPKHLQFIDTDMFDKQLSTAMSNQHYEIQISMLTPFSTNNVPQKLDTWLTVISDFGGEVNVEPVETEMPEDGEKTGTKRSFIVPIALALFSMYKDYRNQQKYEAAENYNATVFYKQNEQGEAIVEKIVFSHKEKSANITP